MSNNIAAKLQAILSAKGDIKDAIEGKGVTVGSASLDQYANLILQISGGDEPLPYDAEVEYLESSGTQYIDTGIIPDASTGLIVKTAPTNNNDQYVCGCRNDSTDTRFGIAHRVGYYYGYGTYLNNQISNTPIPAIVSLNIFNDKSFKAGSTATELPSLSFTPVNGIRIFGRAGYVSSDSTYSGKVYFFKISQDDKIIMDLIPVRVGQVGYMYDKVSKQLFGNAGTGNFVLGQDLISDSEALSIITQGV